MKHFTPAMTASTIVVIETARTAITPRRVIAVRPVAELGAVGPPPR